LHERLERDRQAGGLRPRRRQGDAPVDRGAASGLGGGRPAPAETGRAYPLDRAPVGAVEGADRHLRRLRPGPPARAGARGRGATRAAGGARFSGALRARGRGGLLRPPRSLTAPRRSERFRLKPRVRDSSPPALAVLRLAAETAIAK